MKHKSLEEVRNEVRAVTPPTVEQRRAVRRNRLERLATVLDHHEGPMRLLTQIEYLSEAERMLVRGDDSPLTIAFRDQVLRGQGLRGDRLGDVIDFFSLTQGEAHQLFCDCHFTGAITPAMTAARVRAVARRRSIGEMVGKAISALKFW